MKLLFLAGSARNWSWNKMLARNACDMAKAAGVEATFIDLKDFPMPIYDGDYEEANGLPEKTIELKKIFIDHDGFFIASPEYNSSISPLLKNTLDWVSRFQTGDSGQLAAYQGKIAAICAASPGGLGGLRGLVTLRMMLSNIGVTVIPNQLAVTQAHNMFDNNGMLNDKNQRDILQDVINQFINMTKAVITTK